MELVSKRKINVNKEFPKQKLIPKYKNKSKKRN